MCAPAALGCAERAAFAAVALTFEPTRWWCARVLHVHARSSDRVLLPASRAGSADQTLLGDFGVCCAPNVLSLSRSRPSSAGDADTRTDKARGAEAPGQRTAAS